MQAIEQVEVAASSARSEVIGRSDPGAYDRAAARAAADDAATTAALAIAERLAAAAPAAAAAAAVPAAAAAPAIPADPEALAARLLDAVQARRRAFFAQRSLADAR